MPRGLKSFRPGGCVRRVFRPAPPKNEAVKAAGNEEDGVARRSRLWYGRKRWKDLRKQVLEEANYTCVKCLAIGIEVEAGVVDHVVPHRGDEKLFYDPANLQALCKSCHDRKTALFDGGFGNRRRFHSRKG